MTNPTDSSEAAANGIDYGLVRVVADIGIGTQKDAGMNKPACGCFAG